MPFFSCTLPSKDRTVLLYALPHSHYTCPYWPLYEYRHAFYACPLVVLLSLLTFLCRGWWFHALLDNEGTTFNFMSGSTTGETQPLDAFICVRRIMKN